jgi:hypothetical protein
MPLQRFDVKVTANRTLTEQEEAGSHFYGFFAERLLRTYIKHHGNEYDNDEYRYDPDDPYYGSRTDMPLMKPVFFIVRRILWCSGSLASRSCFAEILGNIVRRDADPYAPAGDTRNVLMMPVVNALKTAMLEYEEEHVAMQARYDASQQIDSRPQDIVAWAKYCTAYARWKWQCHKVIAKPEEEYNLNACVEAIREEATPTPVAGNHNSSDADPSDSCALLRFVGEAIQEPGERGSARLARDALLHHFMRPWKSEGSAHWKDLTDEFDKRCEIAGWSLDVSEEERQWELQKWGAVGIGGGAATGSGDVQSGGSSGRIGDSGTVSTEMVIMDVHKTANLCRYWDEREQRKRRQRALIDTPVRIVQIMKDREKKINSGGDDGDDVLTDGGANDMAADTDSNTSVTAGATRPSDSPVSGGGASGN